jgi:soluble lytic murein transglycosylase-like protein
LAIATVESRLNPNAIGAIGEIGLFQLRPEFHSVKRGEIDHNINVATRYLAKLQKQCAHYGDAFFVCFNYGPGRRLKRPKQFPYYIKVMEVMNANRNERYVVGAN